MVGDILLHQPLQRQAEQLSLGFRSLWAPAARWLERPTMTFANLEGPAAYGLPLTEKQCSFNYDPRVIDDLKDSGFDIISTANNHSLDRGPKGVDRTIEGFRKSNLAYSGTRHTGDMTAPWYALIRREGLSLAWIGCTYSTNRVPDPKRQVLDCYRDTAEIDALVSELSARNDVDGVIVTPHWSDEYDTTPNEREKRLARRFFHAGALAVVGAHPHVLQTWEKVKVEGRERFVAYSLGNFVSNQFFKAPQTTSTILLFLGLTRTSDGSLVVNGVRNMPMVMTRAPYQVQPLDRHQGQVAQAHLSHIRGFFGTGNEIGSREKKLVTNPECR